MAGEETSRSSSRVEKDDSYRRILTALFKNLRSQAISNAEYFQDSRTQNSERFHASFRRLYEHLDRGIEPGKRPGLLNRLGAVVRYNISSQTQAFTDSGFWKGRGAKMTQVICAVEPLVLFALPMGLQLDTLLNDSHWVNGDWIIKWYTWST